MNNTIIGADTSPDEVMEMIRTPREDGKEGIKMAVSINGSFSTSTYEVFCLFYYCM